MGGGLLCIVALVGAQVAAAAQWGAPVSTEVSPDAIATVVDDGAGVPQVVTVLPPHAFTALRKGVYNQDQSAQDVNAHGDFVGIVATPPRVVLSYRAAGAVTHLMSPPDAVATPTDFLDAGGVSVAIDPDGNAVAAWYHPDGRLTIATHSAHAAAWDPPTTLPATTPGEPKTLGALDMPTVVAGRGGSATVIWQDYYSPAATSGNIKDHFDGLRIRLRVTTRANLTAAWSPTQTVRTTLTASGSLRVAFSPAGAGVAIWGEASTLGAQGGLLRSASIGADGTWSVDPDPLGATPDRSHAQIALAVGTDGAAILAGSSFELTTPGTAEHAPFVVRRRPAGGQWGPPELLRYPLPTETTFAAVEDIDVSPAGHVVVLASRAPGGFRPSGSDLDTRLVAAVAPPGGPFSALTDLHPPTTRTQVRSSVGVDASGAVTVGMQTALRTFDTRRTGPDRFTLIQYSDSAVPAPPLPPARIAEAHGPPRVLDAGALGWIHLTLTRPVEDMPVVVTERRGGRDRVVARWRISGTRPFVPVRMTRGRHVFRVEPDGVVVAGVSEPVTMTARPARHRMIQVPPGHALEDYTISGGQMWLLTTSYNGAVGTLQRYDTRTARRRGAPIRLDWRTIRREGTLRLAVGPGAVWIVDRATATPVHIRLGRVGATLNLGLSAEGYTQAAAVDDRSRLWVVANDDEVFRSPLIEVDASRGVRRRIRMAEGPSGLSDPKLGAVGHTLMLRDVGVNDPDGPSFRIDTRSGRISSLPGWSIAGNGQQWQLTARTLRRLSSPPLTIPIPRTPAGKVHKFGGLATAPTGLWLRWATVPEDDVRSPVPLRFVSGSIGKVGPPITVTLSSGDAPGDADGSLFPEPLVAGPGGAWLPFVSDGVLVQVPAP